MHRMRQALAHNRGVEVDAVSFSEAVRGLLVDRDQAARELAGQPGSWPTSRTIEVPADLWDGLTDCRNRLSHSQGSLYTIMRKLNFDAEVTNEEVREAFEAVQASKRAVTGMEDLLVHFVQGATDAAVAKSDAQAS
ncbi:hypothetical protein C8046_16730 [Serinibacter arcticus]|uniref:Uncharacterized protein n=1 Tax=Serinibacter arcticus TaxID=1655435 RepID=A0A2U1ZYK0_9MICO|nr:hypothetical protein C8046_16730 [Serinibacter arcticus]